MAFIARDIMTSRELSSLKDLQPSVGICTMFAHTEEVGI